MLFRNTLATSAGNISGYVLSFIIAPVMLARLGLDQFGVWAVTGALATYAALLDLGVARAMERYVAYYHARGERDKIEQLVALGLVAVTAVALVAGLAALAASSFLAETLENVLTADEMRTVLLCSVGILAFNTYRGVLSAVPEGMLQMVPPNLAFVFYNVVSFVLSLAALLLSRDLVVYAVANVVAAAIGLVAGVVAVRSVWSPIRVRRPSRPLVKEVLGYGLKSQVSWFAELVNFQVDKVVIALVVDVRAAGAYELASRAAAAVRTVGMMSFAAMLSTATSEIARDGAVAIRSFYRRYMARALGLSVPVMIAAAASAPAVLVAWLGELPDNVVALFVVLTLANVMNLSTGVANSLTLGEGKAGVVAWIAVGCTATNIVLTAALAPFFELWGVVVATVLALVGSAIVFVVWFHRTHGLSAGDYLRPLLGPAILATVASLPGLLIILAAGVPSGDRPSAAVLAILFVALFAAIYWPVATHRRYLPDRLELRPFRPRAQPST